MGEWNFTIENSLEKSIKIEKLRIKTFNFSYKIATDCKF